MEKIASVATVVASAVAVIAFLAGLWQFNQTLRLTRGNLRQQSELFRHEREAKAIDLFLRFSELQHRLAGQPLSRTDEATFWQHNALLGISESIYKLTAGDTDWGETVLWMLQAQKPFIGANRINCKTFTPAFIEKMRETVPELQCL